MKSTIVFLCAILFFQFSYAKEYIGINICSPFNLAEFTDYLKRSHNTGASISKSKIGNGYDFLYTINDEKYEVKVSLVDNLIFEVEVSPFLNKKSKFRQMLIKKYGYGKSVTDNKFLGDMRLTTSYLKLNDPEVRLYTSKIITADGLLIADESIVYQCASIAVKKAELEKKSADELKKNKPKMTF